MESDIDWIFCLAASGLNLGSLGRGTNGNSMGASNFSGIPGLVKPKTNPDGFGAGLNAFNQQPNRSFNYLSSGANS